MAARWRHTQLRSLAVMKITYSTSKADNRRRMKRKGIQVLGKNGSQDGLKEEKLQSLGKEKHWWWEEWGGRIDRRVGEQE